MERLKVGKYLIFRDRLPSEPYLIAGSFKTPNSSVMYILVDNQNVLFGFFLTGRNSRHFARYHININNQIYYTVNYSTGIIDIGLTKEIINKKRDSWISASVQEIKRLSRETARKFYNNKYNGAMFNKLPVYRRKMLNELDSYLHPDKYIIEFI